MEPQHAVLKEKGENSRNEDYTGFGKCEGGKGYVLTTGHGQFQQGKEAALSAVAGAIRFLRFRGREIGQTPWEVLATELARGMHIAFHSQQERKGDPMIRRTGWIFLVLKDGKAYWSNVGNSRLFFFRGGRLLTETEGNGGLLGAEGECLIELNRADNEILPGDVFLMANEGFWSRIPMDRMEAKLAMVQDPAAWLQSMWDEAVEGGNSTAIAVFV